MHLGVYGGPSGCGGAVKELNSALQGRGETARFAAKLLSYTYGQPEKETTSEDVEAQTPEAPQSEPPQKAHLAEIMPCEKIDRVTNPLSKRVFTFVR